MRAGLSVLGRGVFPGLVIPSLGVVLRTVTFGDNGTDLSAPLPLCGVPPRLAPSAVFLDVKNLYDIAGQIAFLQGRCHFPKFCPH